MVIFHINHHFSYVFSWFSHRFFSVYQRVFSISMGILQALEALESWKIIDSPGKTSPRVHVESRQQQGLVPRGSPFLMNGRSLCCSLW
jgi:predicted signal transduction protein with EAL and GGDEF domain